MLEDGHMGTTMLSFQSEGTVADCRTRMNNRTRDACHQGNATLKRAYGRPSGPTADSVHREGLLSLCELFCGTSAPVPVRACPVMGIVSQIDGIHARISQINTRYLQEGPEVGEVLDDIIETLTTSFHFILTASLMLLSPYWLIHASAWSMSAVSSSFVARRQRSLWEHVLLWASSAFLFKS